MSLYLLINIAIVFVPLLFSFEKKLKFYKKLPAVLLSMVIVGVPFIVWDVFATERGDWGFNTGYISGYKIFTLPIEEILFFVTVPYAIIFLYETYRLYLPGTKWDINNRFLLIVSLLSLFTGILFYNQQYTFTVFIVLSVLFFLLAITKPVFLKQKNFGLFMLFTFIPFGIVNYILTSVPIVMYGENAIWGIRITSIPLEDFFYSFTLVLSYIYSYELAGKNGT